MALTNSYLQGVYETVQKRNPNEPEFQQAVYEVLESLEPVVEARPELEKNGIMERIVEPERMFMFRVPWVDDQARFRLTAASAYSSTPQSAPTRAVCVCTPLLTHPLSSSSALSSASRTA